MIVTNTITMCVFLRPCRVSIWTPTPPMTQPSGSLSRKWSPLAFYKISDPFICIGVGRYGTRFTFWWSRVRIPVRLMIIYSSWARPYYCNLILLTIKNLWNNAHSTYSFIFEHVSIFDIYMLTIYKLNKPIGYSNTHHTCRFTDIWTIPLHRQ